MADDFNSSDSEYEAPAKPHPRAGERSIELMNQNKFEDRKTSKKRLRTLEDTLGAPGSVYARSLWYNRFEHYCRMNNTR